MHQTVDAVFDADKDTEVGDVANAARDDGPDGELLFDDVPGVVVELLHAQADAVLLQVDVEHNRLDLGTELNQLAGVLDPLVPRHLGDVNQAFDALLQFDEDAVVGHGDDLALDHGTDGIALADVVPGILTQLLVSQAHPLALGVELEDTNLHLVADVEHLGGVTDAAPAHVSDVQQSVDATEVDECTVVGQVLDRTVDDRADLQLADGLLALRTALFLEQNPAGQHDVAALLVELDDLEGCRRADEALEVLHRPQIDLGTRQEGLDANVDVQPTLDAGDDGAFDDLVLVDRLLDLVPGLHHVGLFLGQNQRTVPSLEALEVDLDFVTYLDGRLAAWLLELAKGHGAF